MYLLYVSLIAYFAISSAQYNNNNNNNGQYNSGQYNDGSYDQPAAAPAYQGGGGSLAKHPAILSHKQALAHDGGFNYVFTADNGLKQGESISPDGTRTGAYQYVDPNGKTISVKYTAGKEGFRILEGDHIPKAPVPQHPVPQPAYQSYQPPAPVQQYQPSPSYNTGAYQPQQQNSYQAGPQTFPKYQPQYRTAAPQENAQQDDKYYDVQPGKPHSFGTGYSFEFAG